MYLHWAKKRRMQFTPLVSNRGPKGAGFRFVLAVSGFGAHSILAAETGLHVLERPGTGSDKTKRISARVTVVPQPADPGDASAETRRKQARDAFAAFEFPSRKVVRRYREEPSPLVRDAVLGQGGLAEAIAPDTVLADMSTSYPLETTSLAQALEGTGIQLVDAPVSGGVWRAELGKLTIMAGGEAETIDRIEPALAAMGTVFRTGKLGSGHAMKVLNNYLSASGLAAACEAVLIGRRFGLDPDVMADVFNVSTGKNNATEVKLKQQINNGEYAAGFTMGLMAKDLRMAATLASDMEVEAEGLVVCRDLYNQAEAALGPKADHTEVMRLIEGGRGE